MKKELLKPSSQKVPIFLRKTFDLVSSSDSNICTWSDDGLSFIIKNIDTFTEEVIPQYFKHSKFASFVRQLNFYGFRKIKNESLRINHNINNDAHAEEESNYWRFRHDLFQRGRPDLLAEIHKTNQQNNEQHASKEEVTALKLRINELELTVAEMSKNMKHLISLAQIMTSDNNINIQQQQQQQQQYPRKKRKLLDSRVVVPESVKSYQSIPNPDSVVSLPLLKNTNVQYLPNPSTASDADLLMENNSNNYESNATQSTIPRIPIQTGKPEKVLSTGSSFGGDFKRSMSGESAFSLDSKVLADLYEMDPSQDFNLLGTEVTTDHQPYDPLPAYEIVVNDRPREEKNHPLSENQKMLNVKSRDASQHFMPAKIKEEEGIHDHSSNNIASGTLTPLVTTSS
jgi:hypothetical protein